MNKKKLTPIDKLHKKIENFLLDEIMYHEYCSDFGMRELTLKDLYVLNAFITVAIDILEDDLKC